MRRLAIALVLTAPMALGACGLRGDLKTPPPIWGEDERSAEEMEANKPTPPRDSETPESPEG